MKLLVHGASLVAGAAAGRMRLAAAGLALRGHQMLWLGPGAPAPLAADGTIQLVTRGMLRIPDRVDLVLGGPSQPFRTAVSGWLAGAHAMLLALEPGSSAGWSVAGAWAFGSLDSAGIFESGSGRAEPDAAAEAAPAGVAASASGVTPAAPRFTWPADAAPGLPDATHADTEALERAGERWLARRRGHAPRPAAFLDRDGTLVVEKGYLAHPDELELLPGAVRGLTRLRDTGYLLVVVSNQAGVGRGYFPLARVYEVMGSLRRQLRGHGLELDAVYFCPHVPDAGCDCRKPSPGLLRQAARNLGIALKQSVMIGDKRLDVETGHRAKALGILVRTGYGGEEERVADTAETPPDFVAGDLADAAEWLMARGGD